MKSDSPDEAIVEFLGVPALEPEMGEWLDLTAAVVRNSQTNLLLFQGIQRLKAGHQTRVSLKEI
jgi:hypothetical protein